MVNAIIPVYGIQKCLSYFNSTNMYRYSIQLNWSPHIGDFEKYKAILLIHKKMTREKYFKPKVFLY